MVIIETHIFTRLIFQHLSDDDYKDLQVYLLNSPGAGDVIRGSGGLRKLRWGLSGKKGKRGGLRIIYYMIKEPKKILMLYVYKKNAQSDLTPQQLKILKQVLAEEFL